jgi:hypothetical protein
MAIANVGELLGGVDARKEEEETGNGPEMQYGKNKESTGGKKRRWWVAKEGER